MASLHSFTEHRVEQRQVDGTRIKRFRAVSRENGILLGDLWAAFWRGEFERAGETGLRYQHLPATREMLIRLGAPHAAGFGNYTSRDELPGLIAEVLYEDVDRNFREKIFEEIEGNETLVERLRKWRKVDGSDHLAEVIHSTHRSPQRLAANSSSARPRPRTSCAMKG